MRDVPPLAGLRLALVGPGRVGTTLAGWSVARGARLVRVGGRRPEVVKPLARWTGAEAAALDHFASGDCDLLLLTVADGALAEVARTLSGRAQAPVALHTAGSLGASVLAPLAAPGADSGADSAVGSLHPLKAFPRALPEEEHLARAAGTFYALDGAPEAVALGARLAAAFGGVSGVVPEAARDVYHLGASVAAGGVATLLVSAGAMTEGLGLGPGMPAAILRGYLALARSAVDALESAEGGSGPAAITGPLARGDHQTFLREMESLRRTLAVDPGDDGSEGSTTGRLALLCRLGLETVRLTAGDADARALEKSLRTRGLLPLESG